MSVDTKVVVDLSSGEPVETRVPLDDVELKQRTVDADEFVALPVAIAALPAGVVGWPCKGIAGVVCTHPPCMPDQLGSVVGSPA